MRKKMPPSERGQVWAVFLACLAVLMVMAAIIADLAPAYTDKVAQRAVLDRVEQEMALPSSTLVDSQQGTESARSVAERAVSTARDAGFTGTVEVWFYEPAEGTSVGVAGASPDKIDANDRLWAWCVRLTEGADTLLSGFTGTQVIEVSTETAGSANPYARARVYRPPSHADTVARKYTSSSGDALDAAGGSSFEYAEAPVALKRAFESAYADLRDRQ